MGEHDVEALLEELRTTAQHAVERPPPGARTRVREILTVLRGIAGWDAVDEKLVSLEHSFEQLLSVPDTNRQSATNWVAQVYRDCRVITAMLRVDESAD